jgi:hypothetical protein
MVANEITRQDLRISQLRAERRRARRMPSRRGAFWRLPSGQSGLETPAAFKKTWPGRRTPRRPARPPTHRAARQSNLRSSSLRKPERIMRAEESTSSQNARNLSPLVNERGIQDAVASDPEEDRCLCHSVGAPQVQADAPSDQQPATSGEPPARRPLATLSWQRPDIASRVNEMFMHGSGPGGETPPGNSPPPKVAGFYAATQPHDAEAP